MYMEASSSQPVQEYPRCQGCNGEMTIDHMSQCTACTTVFCRGCVSEETNLCFRCGPATAVAQDAGADRSPTASEIVASDFQCLMATYGRLETKELAVVDPLLDDHIWGVIDTACNSSCHGKEWRENMDVKLESKYWYHSFWTKKCDRPFGAIGGKAATCTGTRNPYTLYPLHSQPLSDGLWVKALAPRYIYLMSETLYHNSHP